MTPELLTIIVPALVQGGSKTFEDATTPTARSPRPAMARHDEAELQARNGQFLASGGGPAGTDPWS